MEHLLLKFFLVDCIFMLIGNAMYHTAKGVKDEAMKDFSVRFTGITMLIAIVITIISIFIYS